MKSILRALMILMISILTVSCDDGINSFTGFIIWKYNKEYDFEYLKSKSIEERSKNFGEVIRIPFSDYKIIYWDEQVYIMDWGIYKMKYRNAINNEYSKSDGSMFFSLIYNNSILFDGVIRTAPTAAMQKYDDMLIPRLYDVNIDSEYENLVYSRISLASSDIIVLESIWDEAKKYNIDIDFLNSVGIKLKNIKKPKIIYGRYDLYEIIKTARPLK